MLVETPLDCLQLLFSDKDKSIVEQSNRYHGQQSNNVTGDRWKDITIAETKSFKGILLAMVLSITTTVWMELINAINFWHRIHFVAKLCNGARKSLWECLNWHAVINSMVIYFKSNSEFAVKYQTHKLYRVELIHQPVQPLLDCKASGEISYYSVGRWPPKMNEVHLVGKHYPESKHPLRKYCMLCGYKYKDGKHPLKKNMELLCEMW